MDICKSCGSELNGSDICPNCGAKAVQEGNNTVPAPEKRSGKGFIKLAVAIVLVAVCYFLFFGGRGYETTAKQYVNAIRKGDAKKIVSLLPKKYSNYIVKYRFDGDKSDFIDNRQVLLDDLKDAFSENDIEITDVKFEIDDKYVFDKDDLKEIRELKKLGAAKKAMRVNVELTLKIDDEEKYASFDLILVKFGRSWYVYDTYSPDGFTGFNAFKSFCDKVEEPVQTTEETEADSAK